MLVFVCTYAATAGLSNATLVGAATLFAADSHWPQGSDACPAFTPDGRTVLFTHSDGVNRWIMISHLRKGVWSRPEVASFSGKWRDIEPAMAPDGSYLVFISNRPAVAGGEPLTGFFGGASRPGAGGNIWRVNREGDGWGEPVRLPTIVNSNSAIYSPAVARDGSIYFNQPDPITKKSHIYRAQSTIHGFEMPIALSISDGTVSGYDTAIAPDESFIVFSSNRVPAPPGQSLLFVAFAQNGHWTVPEVLQPVTEGLEARFSPDLKVLYYSADMASSNVAGSSAESVPIRIFQRPILIKNGSASARM
jgi:Tol biopolymer transport system component